MIRDLPDGVLCDILRHLDGPDLCRVACACRKFHSIASAELGEAYWHELYVRHYGWRPLPIHGRGRAKTKAQAPASPSGSSSPPPPPAVRRRIGGSRASPDPPPGGCERTWKSLYRDRFLESKRCEERARWRKEIAIQNQIHDVRREVQTLTEEANDLARQERNVHSLCIELDRSRRAEVALKTWTPVSVNVFHRSLVEQAPAGSPELQLQELESKLKVTRLLLKGVLKRLNVKKKDQERLEASLQQTHVVRPAR